MALSKIGSSLLDLNSDLTMTGTTPTLTIGDAGAEDSTLQFDGNAQDYYIALDDRADDLVINVTKTKKMSNMRSSGNDDKVKIAPPIIFTLEEALEYIQKDEYVEVTPNHLRLRKILLTEVERKRNKSI